MSLYADSNYSFNPWMKDVLPQMQPDLEGIALTEAEEMLEVFQAQSPVPPEAPIQPRFGAVKTYPTVDEVLGVPPVSGLRDAETGQQGYGGPALGQW